MKKAEYSGAPKRRLSYEFFRWDNDRNNFDIEGKELSYSQIGPYHGFQCNHSGDSPEYKKILNNMKRITALMNEIDVMNSPSYKVGVCRNKVDGSCPLPNVHCAYPECEKDNLEDLM